MCTAKPYEWRFLLSAKEWTEKTEIMALTTKNTINAPLLSLVGMRRPLAQNTASIKKADLALCFLRQEYRRLSNRE